jgi:hypothetical protein
MQDLLLGLADHLGRVGLHPEVANLPETWVSRLRAATATNGCGSFGLTRLRDAYYRALFGTVAKGS